MGGEGRGSDFPAYFCLSVLICKENKFSEGEKQLLLKMLSDISHDLPNMFHQQTQGGSFRFRRLLSPDSLFPSVCLSSTNFEPTSTVKYSPQENIIPCWIPAFPRPPFHSLFIILFFPLLTSKYYNLFSISTDKSTCNSLLMLSFFLKKNKEANIDIYLTLNVNKKISTPFN